MTVLAVGSIQSINYNSSVTPAGTYYVVVGYAGLDSSNPVSGSVVVSNIPGYKDKCDVFELAKASIQADLVANFSYVFNTGDTVSIF